MRIERRSFLKLGAAAAIPSAPVSGFAQTPSREPGESTHVKFTSDGLALTPREHAQLLGRLVEERNVAPDSYAIGGVVEELEQTFATLLKKERAIYMPTGTLANHLAVRALAPDGRVAVQEISHLYQDTGDCVQTLSNRPMMPLAPGKATFSPDDLETLLSGTQTGRVKTSVSVVSIETPVRRANGEIFDAAAMDAVIRIARRNGTRLHLDGARLFIQAAYTGQNVAAYAEPFDTVYSIALQGTSTRRPGRSSQVRGGCWTTCSPHAADVRRLARGGVAFGAHCAALRERLQRTLHQSGGCREATHRRVGKQPAIQGHPHSERHEYLPIGSSGIAAGRVQSGPDQARC